MSSMNIFRSTIALTLLIVVANFNGLIAQERLINGVVKSENGTPIAGATVSIEELSIQTITDSDGNFRITAPTGIDSLTFSYVGYTPKQEPISSRSNLEVVLYPVSEALDEVVVVGFGKQKKVNLTGSVATIEGSTVANQSALQVSTALQGVASGISVTRPGGGQPGAGATIRIRGVGSIGDAAKSDALVLIDGIPGDIDHVNPNDIERLSVLKDAASASIYGSRAANGVILITTKRAGDVREVNYSNGISFQSPTMLPRYVDGFQYITRYNEAAQNEGREPVYPEQYVNNYRDNWRIDPDRYPNTDWNDVMYKDAVQQNHFVSLVAGTDRVKTLASIGYMKQGGIMDNSALDRVTFRLNSNISASDRVNFAFDVSGNTTKTVQPSYGGANASNDILYTPPIYAPKYSDGRWGVSSNGRNPKALINDAGTEEIKEDEIFLNLTGDYKPIPNLTLLVNAAARYNFENAHQFVDTVGLYEVDATTPSFIRPTGVVTSSLNSAKSNGVNVLFKGLATYELLLADHHGITLLAGTEHIRDNNDAISAFRDNFVLSDYQVINAGSSSNMQNSGNITGWALSSYFGRVNYNYKEKYLLEANLRYDGSSRLSPANRWDWFPSASVGWRVSEERFMAPLTAINHLKIRGSWGVLGNQNIGLYPFVSTIDLNQSAVLGNTRVDGASALNMANADIGWEKTEMVNVGIEIGLFDKLDVEMDYFVKNTKDILLSIPIPLTVGLGAPVQNAGELRNYGYEINLNYRNNVNTFNYRIGLNFSDIANKVMDLKGTGPFITVYGITKEGYPINSRYVLEAERLFQTTDDINSYPKQFGVYGPGDIKYVDFNGDDIINAADRQIFSNNYNRYFYGGTFSADYKGVDFSVFLQGVLGVKKMLAEYASAAFSQFATPQQWMLDYWTPDNPGASYPRLLATYSNNVQASSFFMRNASYLRVKNIQLGYRLPTEWLADTFIKNCRVYVSGQDCFTFTNYFPGWDPENESVLNRFYPLIASYNFGVNVKF